MGSKSKSIGNKNKNAPWISLHEFSYAEFSSAIEMLQAAKRSQDPKTAKGFIRHALDEYRHTNLLRSIIYSYTEDNPACFREVRFCSHHAITKGYLNPSKFLFEKYDIERFSIFIGINEQSANRIFTKLCDRFANLLQKTANNSREAESYIHNIILASKVIEKIIRDEENHEKISFIYARQNVKKWKLIRFLIWERISNRVRHFYASNITINKWISGVVYFIVIMLITPFRFVFSPNPSRMTNLISKENVDFML